MENMENTEVKVVKKRGRKPKIKETQDEPGNTSTSTTATVSGGDLPPVEKKKRGRKCKEKVYNVASFDTPFSGFGSRTRSRKKKREEIKVSTDLNVVHLPLKPAPPSTLQNDLSVASAALTTSIKIDYKKHIIIPEKPEVPLTETEIALSIDKRDKETTEILTTTAVTLPVSSQLTPPYTSNNEANPAVPTVVTTNTEVTKFLEQSDNVPFLTNILETVQKRLNTKLKTDINTFLDSRDFKLQVSSSSGQTPKDNNDGTAGTGPGSLETKLENLNHCQTVEYNSSAGSNIKCWWCRFLFEGQPFPLPLRYTHSTGKFKTTGYFCSPNCALAYNNEAKNSGNNYLIIYFIRQLYDPESNVNMDNLIAAPHWKTLKEYGSTLEISDFRSTFYNCAHFDVLEYPMISHNVIIEKTTVPMTEGNTLRLKRSKPRPLYKVQQTF